MRPGLAPALLIVLAWSAPARAERGRLRWRGVTALGKAPARLDGAAQAEVVVALRPLGVEVVTGPLYDAEGAARCTFPGPPAPASCVVSVKRASDGVEAERRAEIPYRDADDLARSLALLLADTLELDLSNLAPDPLAVPVDEPPPKKNDRADWSRPAPPLAVARPAPPYPTARLFIDAGAAVAIGFSGEPLLFGAAVRATWALGPYRLGGALAVTGASDSRDGYGLSFLRAVTGPRVGVGFQAGRLDFDATLGPALFVLATDARPGGHHNLATAAACFGARAAVALARPLALVLAADGVVVFTEEHVDAGPNRVASFGRFSLEVALSLAYRR